MKPAILLCGLFMCISTSAQRIDTFAVKKDLKKVRREIVADTFVQQTFLSAKTETASRIIYRTGIKIIAPGNLIYFKATQSILDSMGLVTDKNATIGEYRKLPCYQTADSIFFIFTMRRPSMLSPTVTVETTKGYKGVKYPAKIVMEVNTTSNSPEDRPRFEMDTFTLFKEELLITRRKK